MKVHTKRFTVALDRGVSAADVTREVQDAVSESGRKDGTATVFIVGSTAAVTAVEYEPGVIKDLARSLEVLAPSGMDYEHHKAWHDDNGSSHVRAALIGPSIAVPFTQGRLVLGTWQQIVLLNLDTSAREREVVVSVVGE